MAAAGAVRSWGGSRAGAGRRARGTRPKVPHLRRASFTEREPLHVTLRVVDGLPNLRGRRCFRVVRDALAATRAELGVRVVHFSVQTHHVHLVVEARDRRALAVGVRAMGIRLARRLNVALARRGPVLSDRFHSRVLRTPLAVKRALAYVLNNARHHQLQRGAPPPPGWVDPCSSAAWFDGFSRPDPREWALGLASIDFCAPPPVSAAQTWLLTIGWRRLGLIDADQTPGRHGTRGRPPQHAPTPRR